MRFERTLLRQAGLAGRGSRAALAALAAVSVAALLAACGGGTSQVEDFTPARLFALGDESSVLLPDGRKYGVNVLTDVGALDCAAEPIWVQAVASSYGHVFAECNPDAEPEPRAYMLAAPQARAAGLVAQVDAALALVQPGEKNLATVMVGAHDVWDLYDAFDQDPTRPAGELLAEARSRGAAVAAQLRRLQQGEVRIVLSTVHDVGKSPQALAEKEAHADDYPHRSGETRSRAALISDLVFEFNAGLRVGLQDQEINDGRYIGLVLADEMVQAMVISPGSFGLASATAAACTAALPDCSSATLVEEARSSNHLWADGRWMAYGGQSRLGLLAVSRATNNPF